MQTLLRRILFGLASIPLLAATATAQTQASPPADAAALRAKYDAVQGALTNNPFKRKVTLESTEASGKLAGDIYAVLDHPFDKVSAGLKPPANWCEVLMLHLNTKNCLVQGAGANPTLSVALGRKFDQPLSEAQQVKFVYRAAASTEDFLDVRLSADEGPLSTRDYRIELSATPIDATHTFIHLGYSYAYGTAAKIAMQAYLSTIGSDKIGFTVTGKDGQGAAKYVGGVRGVVERNTMRYYLAIDSFLDAPAPTQLDTRIAAWFDATEQYAKQLHEVDRTDYLAMKNNEFRRMKSGGT